MKKEELDSIIEKIENETSKEKAFFGVHQMDNDDEAYIKANKDGLTLYAIELLKASRDFDQIIKHPKKNIISFDTDEKWINGDIWIGYIEPKAEDRIDYIEKKYKKDWKNFVLGIGCFLTVAIFVIIFMAGIFSVIDFLK